MPSYSAVVAIGTIKIYIKKTLLKNYTVFAFTAFGARCRRGASLEGNVLGWFEVAPLVGEVLAWFEAASLAGNALCWFGPASLEGNILSWLRPVSTDGNVLGCRLWPLPAAVWDSGACVQDVLPSNRLLKYSIF